ncbi:MULTISPECIES: hypothetical protein [unclassified Rhodococcus (in: high G+C Gram-positive bacteria)]|uniref:hypothetical protein n=1 Tax=unclassified Rhodococcus (in: high G+C Gram-positive bacteria) TaxID=192944 RepID=UPI001639E88F|nr:MULTISPECIES: hypothetical protein [unclassified Rhodococcus (in: high G+C Gram-positive bacteria)]MBC2640536.1 hypothetical protein [Rhodococcus sp. 3A]MBC2894718.1 hypothetical protein [Rhodococcus sp. 4CII]
MILLGYRDHNVHELVCHEIAKRARYYDRLGIEVESVPGSDHPEAELSAGLGGSLVEALRGQRRWKVALVHTIHPLFWIWARKAGIQPAGPTVLAAHPEGSIVWAFTQRLLSTRWAGDEAPSVLHFPGGIAGDQQRLEALRSGTADAAVLGSAFAPSALSRLGITDSLFFGAALRFPTAGIAVDLEKTSLDDPTVRKVVAAQTAAIADVKNRAPVALDAVASLLHDSSRTDAQRMLSDYLSPRYGPDPHDVQAAGADAFEWLTGVLHTGGHTTPDFYEAVR